MTDPKPITTLSPTHAQLAWELAAKVRPPEDILEAHGMSAEEFKQMARGSVDFQRQYAAARQAWEAAENSRQRLSAKAAHLLEDGLIQYASILGDANANATTKMAALRDLQALSKMNDTKDGVEQASGAVFNLVFKYGGGKPEKVVGIGGIEAKDEESTK